jgi:hypothetical protein
MKLLLKIKSWLVKTFIGVQKELKILIPIVIDVVNAAKKFADSPTSDFITAITPTKVDDWIIITIRKYAVPILEKLHNWQSIIGVEDINEKARLILKELKTLPKSEANNIKTQYAAEMLVELTAETKEPVNVDQAFIAIKTSYVYPEVLSDEKAV